MLSDRFDLYVSIESHVCTCKYHDGSTKIIRDTGKFASEIVGFLRIILESVFLYFTYDVIVRSVVYVHKTSLTLNCPAQYYTLFRMTHNVVDEIVL